jgi:hypothetical protein
MKKEINRHIQSSLTNIPLSSHPYSVTEEKKQEILSSIGKITHFMFHTQGRTNVYQGLLFLLRIRKPNDQKFKVLQIT